MTKHVLENVSRETNERLNHYMDLLTKWNPRINLVSKSTLNDAWTRHFIDSAQIFDLSPDEATNWCDLGSGGGFPGLVVAIMGKEMRPDMQVQLVESDTRKATFLRTVARELGLNSKVHSQRIEKIPGMGAQVLSARALAALPKLLGYAMPHLKSGGTCLFPKGETWGKELKDAQDQWNFSCVTHKSKTSPDAVILEIKDLSHV
jgi:16S rRNA (guanine527-N7)-methyltransferase